MHSYSKSSRGFTILELMFTVSVLGILLGLAVPSFTETIRNNQLISQNNALIGSMNFARSEALKRSGSVTVCASADAATCSGSTNWATGWIVFNDVLGNGTFDGTDEVLQTTGAAPSQFSVNATNRSFVRFAGSGMAPSGIETFDLIRTGCAGLKARRTSVSLVGRVSTATVACP